MRNLLIGLLLFLSAFSYGGTQIGTVDYIIVRASDGLVFFALANGTRENYPSCAKNGY